MQNRHETRPRTLLGTRTHRLEVRTTAGDTPIHLAVNCGVEVLADLIEAGADTASENVEGKTAAILAKTQGLEEEERVRRARIVARR